MITWINESITMNQSVKVYKGCNKNHLLNLKFITVFLFFIFLVFNLILTGSEKISLKGSDTLGAKLIPRLIEGYKSEGNKVSFEVEDKGSSTAFTNLLNGTADIGMSSRKIKDKEIESFVSKGMKINEIIAAIDMIAVVVNENNLINDISLENIEGIFTSDVSDWSELGGRPGLISTYTRNTSSGTYKSFQKMAMNKRDYGENSQKMEGNEQIANEVAHNINGIGYIGLAYTAKSGLKKVLINGLEADSKNSKTYPLARNLYYYTIGDTREVVSKFLNWVTSSKKAKKIIYDVGFITTN